MIIPFFELLQFFFGNESILGDTFSFDCSFVVVSAEILLWSILCILF